MERVDRVCKNCVHYEPNSAECRRYPDAVTKTPDSWCTAEFLSYEAATHPGTSDNWKTVQGLEGDDLAKVENPLGRDTIISEVAPK